MKALYAVARGVMALPVERWVSRPAGNKANQGVPAFVRDPMTGELVMAKQLPGFAIIVKDDEVNDPDVLRIVAAVWGAR